jgi:Na+/melibiose symporter-like transporter
MGLELTVIYFVLCLIAAIAGRNRRIGFWGYFFCSIIFTPFISLLFLFFAMPRKVRKQNSLPATGQSGQ